MKPLKPVAYFWAMFSSSLFLAGIAVLLILATDRNPTEWVQFLTMSLLLIAAILSIMAPYRIFYPPKEKLVFPPEQKKG